jgi:hypothetical protein
MSLTLDEIHAEALSLPEKSRAELVERLTPRWSKPGFRRPSVAANNCWTAASKEFRRRRYSPG